MLVSDRCSSVTARRFSVVVAVCKHSRGIGLKGALPWRLRSDMAYLSS